MADGNVAFGAGLAVFGVVLGLGAYLLLESVPLTALGIGLIVVGVACALTPSHPLPRRAVSDLLRSSCSNVEALLEALGATRKAVYLPSRMDGRVVAYVPLKGGREMTLRSITERSGRLVVRNGESLGIVFHPPGIELEGGNPGINSNPKSDVDAAGLLSQVLVELSEVAESVRAVRSDDEFVLEVYRPKVDVDYPRFRMVMGSLPSCIAAQVLAVAFSRPVKVIEEKDSDDHVIVRLRLLKWTDTPFT